MTVIRSVLLAAALVAGLSACQSLTRTVGQATGRSHIQGPVGVGPGHDELKQSPCACLPVSLPGRV